MSRVIIAQCIAEAGYGTSSYDEESGECGYEMYASVDEVEVNPEYWEQYEEMSASLHWDFDMPQTFDRYRLTVWSDGTRECKEIEK